MKIEKQIRIVCITLHDIVLPLSHREFRGFAAVIAATAKYMNELVEF